jgi:hypothetical protein
MSETSTQKRQDKGELDQPHWAVVSFDQVEATGLTYPQAVEKMRELDANDVAGLCIVTDDAAARITA